MASLVDTLTGAGLQPLDAQEIANAVALGTGLPTDLPALLQSARRGWWGMDAVDNAYKRLLDPEPGPATPGAPLDVGKAWDYQVGRLAEAGLLDTALARTMLARHIDWAQGTRGTYYFASAEAVAKAYAADLPLPGRALAETYLGAWLDDIIKGGPGSGHFDHDGIPDHQGGSLPSYGRTKPAKEAKPKTVKPAKRRGFIKPTGKLRAEADKGEKVAADVDLFDVQAGEPGKWAEALAYPDYGAKRYQADLKYADRLKEAAGLALMDDVPGITAPMANDFLSDWAVSSNDEHLPSLTHQKLAAQIFGTKLTAWQKEHLVEAERHRASVLGGFMQDMFWDDSSLNANVILDHWDRALSDDASESTHTASLPFERDILHRRAYGPDLPPLHNKEEVLALLADVRKESETLTKAAIKSVYNRTQAKLAEAGVTHLRLFRGAVSLGIDPGEAGQTVTPTTNALSSWTTSEYVADNGFANTESYDYKTRKMMGAVYTAVVPADRVYSLPATGPGTLFEWEAIVIGDATGDPLRIKTTYKADRQSR